MCSLESGLVRLPVKVGLPVVPMDARAIRHHLDELVQSRGLTDLVRIRDACAGGCGSKGPNISVTIYPAPRPGDPPNEIAIAWKTYVYSLPSLTSLAAVIDNNL